MNSTLRRPMLAAAALTTAGALALSPILVTPPDLGALNPAPTIVSTQAVQLTDAWFQLLNDTLVSTILMGQLAVGANSNFPLPNPIFVAPVLTQLLVVNPLTYAVQLFTGQADQIPSEITAHLNGVLNAFKAIGKDVPPAIVKQIQAPFLALQDAIDHVTTSTNPLLGLFEAPAVFLNGVLNGQYGLIGYNGPIAVAFIIRNVLAQQLFTAPPAALPFKKAAAAASTPKAAVTSVAPSGTASSARVKTTTPVAGSRKAAPKAGKAPSAKSTAKSGTGGGQGRSNRG